MTEVFRSHLPAAITYCTPCTRAATDKTAVDSALQRSLIFRTIQLLTDNWHPLVSAGSLFNFSKKSARALKRCLPQMFWTQQREVRTTRKQRSNLIHCCCCQAACQSLLRRFLFQSMGILRLETYPGAFAVSKHFLHVEGAANHASYEDVRGQRRCLTTCDAIHLAC